jgi:DNA repair exonuclease SbcCD ATPase subunit
LRLNSRHYATANDRVEVTKLLLKHGADYTIENAEGHTVSEIIVIGTLHSSRLKPSSHFLFCVLQPFSEVFAKNSCKSMELLVAVIKKIDTLHGRIEALKCKSEILKSQKKSLDEENTELKKQKETFEQRCNTLTTKNDKLTNEVESLEQKGKENTKLAAQKETLEQKNKTLTQKIKDLIKENEALEQEKEHLNISLASQTKAIKTLSDQMESVSQQKEGMLRKNEDLTKQNERYKLDLKHKTKEWELEKESFVKQIAVVREEKEALMAKNKQQKQAIEDLVQKRNQMSGYYESVMAQVSALKESMEGFVKA